MDPLYILIMMCLSVVHSTTIDNEVVGPPEVACAPEGLTIRVRTRNPFRGKLYVRGQYGIESCRAEFYNNVHPEAQFAVRYGDCGMQRIRQLEPQGVNYALVIVTSFHPQFITVVDRSFNVRCFFGQSHQKVTNGIEVGTLPPLDVIRDHPMRPCEYTVHVGSVDGPIAHSVNIGEKVFHVFQCFTPGYGMLVKNCVVSDGGQTAVPVVDERGCSIMSEVVQGPLVYHPNLMSAYAEVEAYKLPDRNQVYYQCEISLCSINTNECMGVTPPNCPMVPPAEFVPNAIVNPNVDPTQVYGTFGTDAFNGIPQVLPTQGYTNNLPPLFGPFTPTPFLRPFAGPLENEQVLTAFQRPYTKSFAVRRHENGRGQSAANRTSIGAPDLMILTRPSRSSSDPSKVFSPVSDSSKPVQRKRRDEQTMDVVAAPIEIRDMDDLERDSSGTKRMRPETIHPVAEVCIRRGGFAAMVASFALVLTCCLATSAYVFYDIFLKRSRRRKGLITRRPTVSTAASRPHSPADARLFVRTGPRHASTAVFPT